MENSRGQSKEIWDSKKQKKEKTIEIKKMAEKWEIWDKKEEAARSEKKEKKLVPKQFHKWIKILEK